MKTLFPNDVLYNGIFIQAEFDRATRNPFGQRTGSFDEYLYVEWDIVKTSVVGTVVKLLFTKHVAYSSML